MGYLYSHMNAKIPDAGGLDPQPRLPKPTRPLMGHHTAHTASILLVVPMSEEAQLVLLYLPALLATTARGWDDESPHSAAE